MKLILSLVTLSLSICTIAQELNCCNSMDDVKSILEGSWQLKDVEHLSSFEYSFSENKQLCTIIQEFVEEDKEDKVINHLSEITISEDEIGYVLDWKTELFHWDARILKLKSRKMILEINGSQIEFKKNRSKD